MKKRLFIDSDQIQDDELRRAKRRVSAILDKTKAPYCENVFDSTQGFAWHQAKEAWEAVKNADEIYGDTSLVPLSGYGTYTGSVVVMDVMMKKALDENIIGKQVFFLRPFMDIEWGGIDKKLLKQCFRHKNELFTLEFDGGEYHFAKVNVNDIK